jgi:murein L,D-transpeptidase YcbB/YkuD
MFLILLVRTIFLVIISAGEAINGDSLREQIRIRIEANGSYSGIRAGDEIIYSSSELLCFYERRSYLPAWSKEGKLRTVSNQLMECINGADEEGLNPEDYHINKIKSLQKVIKKASKKGETSILGAVTNIDLLLTDAFLIYAAHLLAGRVDPAAIDPEWNAVVRQGDMVAVLEKALDSGNIQEALESLLPPQKGYRLLKKFYAKYQKIAFEGGWPDIPNKPYLPLKIEMRELNL